MTSQTTAFPWKKMLIVGVITFVILLGLIIGMFILSRPMKITNFPTVYWNNPQTALSVFNSALNQDQYGPVYISGSPSFENLWTVNDGQLIVSPLIQPTNNVSQTTINSQLWYLQAQLGQGWQPVTALSAVDPVNIAITIDTTNNVLSLLPATNATFFSFDATSSCFQSGTRSLTFAVGSQNWLMGQGLNVVPEDQNLDCSQVANVFIGTIIEQSSYIPFSSS